MADAERYLSNAGTGAMIGGAAGSVVPGVGTLAGAGIGGLVGLGYTYFSDGGSLWDKTTGQVNTAAHLGPQDQVRANQEAALGTVGNWAFTGEGPSTAQDQLAKSRAESMAMSGGVAKEYSGGNPALQANLAANMQQKQAAAGDYNAAILRSQEQQQAMDNYLKGLQAEREADIDVFGKRLGGDIANANNESGFIQGLMGGLGGGLGGMF